MLRQLREHVMRSHSVGREAGVYGWEVEKGENGTVLGNCVVVVVWRWMGLSCFGRYGGVGSCGSTCGVGEYGVCCSLCVGRDCLSGWKG